MSEALTFNQYQSYAASTAVYPESVRCAYSVLGLADEAGELIDKVRNRIWPDGEPCMSDPLWIVHSHLSEAVELGKKLGALKKRLRGDKAWTFEKADLERFAATVKKNITDDPVAVAEIAPELGDVLWYAANAAKDLGVQLGDVATANTSKLKSRQARGVLKGDGDNR